MQSLYLESKWESVVTVIITCERMWAKTDCRVGWQGLPMPLASSCSLGSAVTSQPSLFCCGVISAITGGSRLCSPSPKAHLLQENEKRRKHGKSWGHPPVSSVLLRCASLGGRTRAPSLGDGGRPVSWGLGWACHGLATAVGRPAVLLSHWSTDRPTLGGGSAAPSQRCLCE